MKKTWVFIFILILWSFSSFGGILSSIKKAIHRSCFRAFSVNKVQETFIKTLGVNPDNLKIRENRKKTEENSPFFVLIVRHASYKGTPSVEKTEAESLAKAYGLSDIVLRLSEEGKEQFVERCRGQSFCVFDLLLHSDSMRTWETANILSEYLTIRETRKSANLAASLKIEPEDILQEIKSSDAKAVVLVGHQPSLTKFVSRAIGNDTNKRLASIMLRSHGGMILLKFSSWELGSAELQLERN